MNFDVLSKLTSLAIDLDAVVKELLEGSTIEKTVARRPRVIDNELVLSTNFGSGGLGLSR